MSQDNVCADESEPVDDPAIITLKDLIREGNVAVIHAADYNGITFDGLPITLVGKGRGPAWIKEAVEAGDITIGTPGNTDYVSFGIKNEGGNQIWAGPGDYIIRHLVGSTTYAYTLVQGRLLDILRCKDILMLAEL
jgi:hypothetical protein